ncbi:hypothetical protein Q0F98_18185 [Paenibacillus amylolyticus]|nr:hypothetical protein Q0F98_18185 [Paenibacillus amylolyticus]
MKLLKRLSKIYKKLKQEEHWEQFITTLAVRNSQAARPAGRASER